MTVMPITDGPSQGSRVVRFVESFCSLGGSFLGQPMRLHDWQRDIIHDIYRTDEHGKRLHRTYLVGLPRKNGKSQLAAALALYHLIADPSDPAPLVISAAGDRRQARIVFDEAARMVRTSPDLAEVCTPYRNFITCSETGGKYEAVSADAGLQQGLNPSFVVFDELHVFKENDLYEALSLGSATRRQPLIVVISTAGFDLDSPLGRLYSYGLRVRSGEIEDPTFGMTWYGPPLDESWDPADEDLWRRCNPGLDSGFQSIEEFRSAFKSTPESAFVRYRLNGWTSSETSWLPHGAWEALARPERRLQPGERIVVGFDGAWKGDSTALVGISLEDRHVEVLGHWEAPIGDRHWRTPVADVKARIEQVCRQFRVVEIAADPYRFEQTLTELAADGLPIIEYPTNALARIVPATSAFYDAVTSGAITHDGNPALARHLANAVLKEDVRGGRITKPYASSTKRIDLAVAAVIAYHRVLAHLNETEPSEPQLLII